jgi:glycosyltransferase involved in cell wall biosynthesis
VELIEVFSRLASKHPEWHLKIAGSSDDADYRKRVHSAARKSPVGTRISILDDVTGPALWDLFRDCNLFVLPSLTENFGLVVIESLAAGVPVVATHGSPWRELETEDCGWWTPTSLDALRGALDSAMSLVPEELSRRGIRGKALVAARYSSRAQGAALARLYADVVAGSRAQRQP